MLTPLAKKRREVGRTLDDVAADLGVATSTISRMERNLLPISAELAEKICALPYFNEVLSEMEVLYPDRFSAEAA